MTSIVETWEQLSARARIGMLAGALLIVALTAAIGIWAYRADYQVLFSDVAPADAAAMTSELDRLKTPYQLTDGGNTILVPKDLVYKTRLKLMGKELPLHGAVGFEVFNNADFGMTEFVQKVNYLRAIQGELTRTILSIEEIQAARVHLALPEQSLFKTAVAKPKASVTLTTKPGKVLAPQQIAGIQRLVAASVADIVSSDVTVLDQHGVALTRVAQSDGSADLGLSQLDSKRGTEDYLVKKVTEVLDRTFGAGQAVASVDVLLNLDQSKVTTEEVLPAKGNAPDGIATGVVVHERQVNTDSTASVPAKPSGSTVESDYQVGRRVEHTVTAAGTVKRMTIAVLVKQPLSDAQLDKLKEVVMLAVGFNSQRGDAVVVYTMDQFANPATAKAPVTALPELPELPSATAPAGPVAERISGTVVTTLAALAGLGIALLLYLFLRAKRPPPVMRLDADQRARLLEDVRQWITPVADPVAGAPAPGVVRK